MLIRKRSPFRVTLINSNSKIIAPFEHVLNFLGGEGHLLKSDYSYEPSPAAAPEFLRRTVLRAETYWRSVGGGPGLKLAGQSGERLR